MILVTGGSGFLGRHLVQALAATGQRVRALYHSRRPESFLAGHVNVEWHACDLLDIYAVEEVMQGVEHIYHCAAMVSFHSADKEKLLHFNVESTANIVNEALLQGVRKIVHLSSVASLGRSETQKIITEEEAWEESSYNSTYARSKQLSELEVWRGVGEGLDAAILNPGIILGEPLADTTGWDKGSARLMKVVSNEFPFYTGGINSFVDVQDVVKIAMLLMQQDISGERFIVSGGNFAYKDVFTRMAVALGVKPPSIKANSFLTGLVWRWNAFRSSVFGETATVTKETARTAQKQAHYDNTKLLKALPGFSYTSLDDTVKRMAEAFKKDAASNKL